MKKTQLKTLAISLITATILSCSPEKNTPKTVPQLTTTTVSNINLSTAISGGNITSDGGDAVTARGIVWNTATLPTTSLTTKTNEVAGLGNFINNITNLTFGTTYYVRAYATNSIGTNYGNEVSFTTPKSITDIDGNSYQIVGICNQIWTTNNLNVTKYRNGDSIPQVTDPIAWSTLTTGAWCYYSNNTANGPIYGKLYNWYAVNDSRGLAPMGWHIPSDLEFTTLSNCLGGESIAGGKMKATTLWDSPNLGASNSSGFSSLPGGVRYSNGTFQFQGYSSNYWTSTSNNTTVFYRNNVSVNAIMFKGTDGNTNSALSVRCVKD